MAPGRSPSKAGPTGAIFGFKDRQTVLRIQLKPDGSLANVFLETASGVEHLDDEAIQAFRKAQPFPNPPPAGGRGAHFFRFRFLFRTVGAVQNACVPLPGPLTPPNWYPIHTLPSADRNTRSSDRRRRCQPVRLKANTCLHAPRPGEMQLLNAGKDGSTRPW